MLKLASAQACFCHADFSFKAIGSSRFGICGGFLVASPSQRKFRKSRRESNSKYYSPPSCYREGRSIFLRAKMSRTIEAAALFAVGCIAGGAVVWSTRKSRPPPPPPPPPTVKEDLSARETFTERMIQVKYQFNIRI
jgi:hypothetical protein